MLLGAADNTASVLEVALVVVLSCIAVKVDTDTCAAGGFVLSGGVAGPDHRTLSSVGTVVSGEITCGGEDSLVGDVVEPLLLEIEHPVYIIGSTRAALPELV